MSTDELYRLLHSHELRDLQPIALQFERRSLSDLEYLSYDSQLTDLNMLVRDRPATVFQNLESLGRIDRNDERLHTRLVEGFLQLETYQFGLSLVREFLKRATFYKAGARVVRFAIPSSLAGTEIKRDAPSEHGLVDLRIRNARHRFVVLVENKTQSPERPDQLRDYMQDAEDDSDQREFSIAGMFLTPDGRTPQTEGEKFKGRYCALSYGQLAEMLSAAARPLPAARPLKATISQYASAIRRWFVTDPKMSKIAWQIFRKYPEAAAFLSSDDARPVSQVFTLLESIINGDSNICVILPRRSSEPYESSWFVPKDWDDISGLRHAKTRVKEKRADDRLLILWFGWEPNADEDYYRELTLYFGIVPGARPEQAKRLIDSSKHWPASSKGTFLELKVQEGDFWTHIWARRILTEAELNSENQDEVFRNLRKSWERFLARDLPKISESLRALFSER